MPICVKNGDECTHHATLAACYQLVQFVLKVGFLIYYKLVPFRGPMYQYC